MYDETCGETQIPNARLLKNSSGKKNELGNQPRNPDKPWGDYYYPVSYYLADC